FNRDAFFREQGVALVLSTVPRGHGVYTIGGVNRSADPATLVPQVTIPAEEYGRIARILQKGLPVTLEADIRNTYHPNPAMFDVVGEIRGTDKAAEVVMIGAHFDSWHASTGATDNASGSAAMMEAMRILKATGVPLRRTVRIALWNGEEQGLNGSRDYVARHFAVREPVPGGAGAGRGDGRGGAQGPLVLKPAHATLSAYFNIDNGTGALRGVHLQGNQAIAPIFRAWMEPFRDLGMTHLTISNTGGTDHQSFDAVGLPGFQFIQDPVEYSTLTHHTNLDSYERLQPTDMMRNATIVAGFAFLAANREELLPRKPMPVAGGGRGGN
ncbi:MAG TPA: M20/M25/M40 family metallo-hydrolase, partial [Vicinamibacterales bacterium]|nr:M20/M25/M40 family metallo-hydrolase [Vicinamibacterales bacterium]